MLNLNVFTLKFLQNSLALFAELKSIETESITDAEIVVTSHIKKSFCGGVKMSPGQKIVAKERKHSKAHPKILKQKSDSIKCPFCVPGRLKIQSREGFPYVICFTNKDNTEVSGCGFSKLL